MNPLDKAFLSDLVLATKAGNTPRVTELLSIGVRPDIVDASSGWSALHAAVVFNSDSLSVLLEHCIDADGPKVGGGTPLSYVIHELGENPSTNRRQRLIDALNMLLRAGASPSVGGPDQTALELVRLYQLPEIEVMLMGSAAGSRSRG